MSYRDRLFQTYFDTHYSQLGEKSAQDRLRSQEDIAAQLAAFLPKDYKASILDIGCGPGDVLLFLKEKGYQEICGIDVSPQQVEQARRAGLLCVEAADGVDYLGRHTAQFDLILAFDFLEHLGKEDVLVFLDAAHKALKPGGRLVLRTVNGAGLLAGRIIYGDFSHEVAFTQTSLGQVLRVAGFSNLGFAPAYAASLKRGWRGWLRYALWKVFEQMIKLYMHSTTGSGILRSGHIWTEEIIASAEKPPARGEPGR
jgi:2-polyprenyl-3-methyl-5-hydroxy-6-metoxy-1,4-benzoquinol methylase